MALSPEVTERIEAIVSACEQHGVRAQPMEESLDLAIAHPEAVGALARACIARYPRGGTFLDAALAYLPHEDWASLVADALDGLEGASNDAAEAVIEYASLQAPSALQEHFDRFARRTATYPYRSTPYGWRGLGAREVGMLRAIAEDPVGDALRARWAWRVMLQTRAPAVVDDALAVAGPLSLATPDRSKEATIREELRLVGLEQAATSLRRLWPTAQFHLLFPDAFRDPRAPRWRDWVHPTWHLDPAPDLRPMRFGGHAEQFCGLCGGRLHRLVDLDPVPAGLGVSGLPRLRLATCLSCVGWEQPALYYRHDPDGRADSTGYDGPPIVPEFPAEPFVEAEVRLAPTPPRWQAQDWGSSNGRENLHRLGGEPCWIQDAGYLSCPSCATTMQHLLQLDSELPTTDDRAWLWGSGGLGYIGWCDRCKVSGVSWQCT